MKRADKITQHIIKRINELKDDRDHAAERYADFLDADRITFVIGTNYSLQLNNNIYIKRMGESYLEPHEIVQ